MKTITDFKNRIKPGVKIHTVYHQAFAGRNEQGHYLLKDEDRGVRTIEGFYSTKFGIETTKSDGSKYTSWLEWPKLSKVKFIYENTILILDDDFRREGEGGTGRLIPLLTFRFV